MKKEHALFCCAMILALGCGSPRITVAWKNWYPAENFDRILVTSIVKSNDNILRREIEKSFASDLEELGYSAVSSIEEFGPGGLSGTSREESYIKLCNNGIDAVMILALIDKSKEKTQIAKKIYGYPDNYYYQRILSYKNIQADLTSEKDSDNNRYFWEAILFNLRTLKAECTVQTKSFTNIREEKIARALEQQIIKKLIKEKILKKKSSYKKLRAF